MNFSFQRTGGGFIKTIKHILLWIVICIVFCLMFLGIQNFTGKEFLHECCVCLVGCYFVSSVVWLIERKNK